MSKILALDVSSRITGWSILKNGKVCIDDVGWIKINPKDSMGKRLLDFENEIKLLIERTNPDDIIIEDIFKGRNANTFKILSLFRGIAIKTIFQYLDRDPISIMASEVRSIIGVKNSKEDVFDFVTKKYKLNDFNLEEHNDITDSIALALAAHKMNKQGIDERSLRNSRSKKRRKRKRNKKSV